MDPQKAWNIVLAKVEEFRDGLGRPLDPGIKETIVALQVFGFGTIQSCEGHDQGGCCHPWVTINSRLQGKKKHSAKKKLLKLLDEFDDCREEFGEMDSRLVINKLGKDGLRLESDAAKLLFRMPKEILTRAKRAQIQKRHKKEMDAFQSFLKKKFFAQNKKK